MKRTGVLVWSNWMGKFNEWYEDKHSHRAQDSLVFVLCRCWGIGWRFLLLLCSAAGNPLALCDEAHLSEWIAHTGVLPFLAVDKWMHWLYELFSLKTNTALQARFLREMMCQEVQLGFDTFMWKIHWEEAAKTVTTYRQYHNFMPTERSVCCWQLTHLGNLWKQCSHFLTLLCGANCGYTAICQSELSWPQSCHKLFIVCTLQHCVDIIAS